MTTAEPLDVVRRVLEVYSGDMAATFRDPDKLALARHVTDPLFDPDVTFVLPAQTEGSLELPAGDMTGVEALVSLWADWFQSFDSLVQDHTDLEMLSDGKVFVNTDTTVRLPTGETMTFTSASIWDVAAGRIVSVTFGPSIPRVTGEEHGAAPA